ncbi:MAG: antitoxin [Actinomycetales bacterium]|nr:antitoxin [Actinomycetales bacterium]
MTTTLYVRDVPPEVAQVLKERAAAEGKSLSAYVVAELARVASRPTNAEIVARLRTRDRADGPSTTEILDALADARR